LSKNNDLEEFLKDMSNTCQKFVMMDRLHGEQLPKCMKYIAEALMLNMLVDKHHPIARAEADIIQINEAISQKNNSLNDDDTYYTMARMPRAELWYIKMILCQIDNTCVPFDNAGLIGSSFDACAPIECGTYAPHNKHKNM
jgi:hypothetical protein